MYISKEDCQRTRAKRRLLDFITYTKPEYEVNYHHEIICDTLDEFLLPDSGIDRLIIEAPPRTGKLCADSTPVLTTNGWKKHGDLKVGDYVFHPSGKPVKVLAISEKDIADVEVEFFDGSVVKCHRNHEWAVYDRSQSKRGWQTYETNYLQSVKVLSGKDKPRARFQLPLRECLELEEKTLPIEPYFFGVWLGDGKSSDPQIIHHKDDVKHIEKISNIYPVSSQWEHKGTGVIHTSFAGSKIRTLLRKNNLLQNKHIPQEYLLSSKQQRLELLAGLIDNIYGCVCKETGRVTISNINKTLIDNIYDLTMSLGFRSYIIKEEPVLSTSGIQGKNIVYVVGFNPDIKIPTALPRKKTTKLNFQKRKIGIKEVRQSKPEQGHCIQVDSEDGLYLVGKNLITTHNSEIVSRRLPAYALGKNPQHEIVLASYASPLAQRMNRDVQRVMDDERYLGVFPDTTLNASNVAKNAKGGWIRTSDLFEIVKHGGSFRSTGVNGSLTGQGLTIGIIDDPFKDWKEATSKTIKDAVWEWYQSVFFTRLNPKYGKIIVMNTRWAEDDLTGRLLAQAEADEEADQWKVLRFPMIMEDTKYSHEEDFRMNGELLWPDRFPEKRVVSFKKTLGSRIFNALYQQRPAPDEGGLVQRDWWKFYDRRPELDFFDYISTSWDFTFKGTKNSDFVVGQVWGRKGANFYLLDQVRDRMNFSATVMAVKALAHKWSTYREIVVEEKANGAAIIDTLKSEIRGIVPYNPKDSKEARASSITPLIEAGNVFIPDPSIAPWIMDYVEEWAVFPNGANDDQIDATSQMLIRFQKSKNFLELINHEAAIEEDDIEPMEDLMDTFWGNKSRKGLLDF